MRLHEGRLAVAQPCQANGGGYSSACFRTRSWCAGLLRMYMSYAVDCAGLPGFGSSNRSCEMARRYRQTMPD